MTPTTPSTCHPAAGHDADGIWRNVKLSVLKLLLDKAPILARSAAAYPHKATSFFSMYRFDFMIDPEGRPFLMEVCTGSTPTRVCHMTS